MHFTEARGIFVEELRLCEVISAEEISLHLTSDVFSSPFIFLTGYSEQFKTYRKIVPVQIPAAVAGHWTSDEV